MVKKFFKERKLNIICGAVSFVLMWLVWIIAYYSVKNDYIIPSFTDTFAAFFNYFADGAFWAAFFMTLLRTVEAFAISFVLAAACAALSAVSKIFKALLKPVVALLRTLPTLAVILLLLVWTNARVAPVIVAILVLFPMIYAQFNAAIEGLDSGLWEMAEVYGVTRRDRLFKMCLPQISPAVFSQTGANVSLGLKLMVSAEVLASTFKSLGGMMQEARAFVEMPRLAALTVAAVLLGLALDIAFSQLKRLNGKWYKGGAL